MSSSGSESDSSSKIDSTPAPTSKSKSTTKKPTKSSKSKVAADKAKGKGKSREMISDDDEEEEDEEESDGGEEEHIRISKDTKYKPEKNMRPLKIQYASSPFDYDVLVANPNLELWAIRVPDNVKPKQLSGLSLSIPAAARGEPSGSLKLKDVGYSLKSSKTSEAAEEMASLHPMLPRKSKNGYIMAPRPITNHLILTPIPLKSSAPSKSASASAPVDPGTATSSRYVPPVKPPRLQPVDKLKFRNKPFGYGEPDLAAEAERAVAFAKEKIAIAEEGEVKGGMDVAIDGAKSKAAQTEKTGKKRKSMADGEMGTPAGEEKKKKKSKKA